MQEYLNSVQLVKECMELNSRIVIKEVKKNILKYLIEIALVDKQLEVEQRGQRLFTGNNKNKSVLGTQVVRLVLECVKVWSIYYPLDDILPATYYKLL